MCACCTDIAMKERHVTDSHQLSHGMMPDASDKQMDGDAARIEQVRGFVASTGLVSWVARPTGALIDARQWCAFTGQLPDAQGHVGWLEAVHPDDRASLAERREALLDAPRDFSYEFRLRRYDGQYRQVVSKGTPLLGPNGKLDEWVGTITDVTDFRQQADERDSLLAIAQSARTQAESLSRQLQALQRVTEGAMSHLDLRSLVRELLACVREAMAVDNAAILLLDDNEKHLVVYEARGPEEQVTGKARIAVGRGIAGTIAARREPIIVDDVSKVEVENPLLRETGHSLVGAPLLLYGRLLGVIHVDSAQPHHFTDDDAHLLQVIADRVALAVDRARLYEDVERQRERAEQRAVVLQEATERMDRFLGIASHELRTPLTSLRVNVQMLDYWTGGSRPRHQGESEADYVLRTQESVRPLVARSLNAVARLDRLIQDLLDASRVREQRLEMHQERADLRDFVREAVEEQRQVHPGRQITLALLDEPALVSVDAGRIGQVLVNLLSNALKYSKRECPVEVTMVREGSEVRVRVRDQGPGIPATEHERIWERFYRVQDMGHQSGSQVGLGLGLFISRDIVERHNGRVGLQSTPGQGSTFWFALPLLDAS
jgi:PAS domain S-box-containing protein